MTEDGLREVGRVRIDCRKGEVRGTLAFLMPISVARQFVGKMLTVKRGNVSSLGSESCVRRGRNQHLDIGFA